jgi:RND family efflux transporter MFP subunit
MMSNHKNPKNYSYLFKLLLIVALLIQMSACSRETDDVQRPPPKVTVATPLVNNVTDWDKHSGRLAAVETVEVRARVSGYLQSVNFNEGAILEKGDLLYVIDPRPYQASLDAAAAEVAMAEATLQLAENDLRRVQRLIKSRMVAEEEVDARTQEKRRAAASLELARAEERAAKLNLEFTQVYSPIKGRIGKTQVTPGNLINGGESSATLLTTIVSLDPIHFYISADEQDYMKYLRLAQSGDRPSSRNVRNPVRLRLADETDFLHEGYMDFVDNQIDVTTGTQMGRAVFKNLDLFLVPGMFAEIQLIGTGPYEAVQIPDSAIASDQSQRFVFVIDENNLAQRKMVTPGRIEHGLRIIHTGLSKEDRVIIKGIQRVRAGQLVDPQAGSIESSHSSTGDPSHP